MKRQVKAKNNNNKKTKQNLCKKNEKYNMALDW